MKTFEEKFTAWVDGELKGRELEEFELELAKVNDASLDKVAAQQLGDLLREHGRAPELRNADFFNHQIMQQIEADMPAPAKQPERRGFPWFPRLAFAAACSLLVAFGIHEMISPATAPQQAQEGNSIRITHAEGGAPEITVSNFYSQKNDVTVLWLDGAGSIPKKSAGAKPESEKPPRKNETPE